MNILDIGTGTGFVAFALAPRLNRGHSDFLEARQKVFREKYNERPELSCLIAIGRGMVIVWLVGVVTLEEETARAS